MNAEVTIPMALFALATSITPGPVNIISAMSGARFGTARSLPYVLGATTSFIVILLLLGFGLGSILAVIKASTLPLTIFGSLYMLYLAWRIATATSSLDLSTQEATCPGFAAGILTQIINPKSWIVSLSAVSLYVGPFDDYRFRLVWFATIFFLICLGSLLTWAYLGSKTARLTGSTTMLNRGMALLLVLAIALIIFDLFRQL